MQAAQYQVQNTLFTTFNALQSVSSFHERVEENQTAEQVNDLYETYLMAQATITTVFANDWDSEADNHWDNY